MGRAAKQIGEVLHHKWCACLGRDEPFECVRCGEIYGACMGRVYLKEGSICKDCK